MTTATAHPDRLPIVCGDCDAYGDHWCLRINGKERWFTPIVAGHHDGYINEQPIINVDGVQYRVGVCYATRIH